MIINTNQNAVDASSAMQRSQSALNRSMARLSTGSKIVRPSDDAAGLSIVEKIQAQNSRIDAAKVNVQNAVSLAQTGDGFLRTMSDVLNRMSELSIMGIDPTKSSNDKALYATEFESLKDQLRDIVGNGPNGTDSDANWNTAGSEPSGTFNGISLFGARADMIVVVGASGDQTMTIGEINLREIGSAISNLLWDNAVDGSQPDVSVSSPGAVAAIGAAIEQVAEARAGLGAEQSRFEIVNVQLQVQQENLLAASSRIKDVDVAEETTRLAKNEILTQASVSMLHKANGLPQMVLRLLN